MKEQYIVWKPKPATMDVVVQANEIIDDYRAQGFSLTLRQLYYQFVARDLIPNTEASYNRLGNIINKARLAGMMDWSAIEDRTRSLRGNSHWDSPRDVIEAARQSYRIDMWENQPNRVEVWIEKEALAGVIASKCQTLDVPYFACKGYVSQSEQWRAGLRSRSNDQQKIILHLGDHDPSGIDMTRDNQERLHAFSDGNVKVERIALNMDQIDQYGPPPNPAKVTDSRYDDYRLNYGSESWELDALEPRVINELIDDWVAQYRDEDLWAEAEARYHDDMNVLNDIVSDLT